jgi:hypothetical protein
MHAMFKQPAFYLDGDVIRIVNSRSRDRSIVLACAAAFLVVLPWIPVDILNWIRDPTDTSRPNVGLCLFGAFACLSAAFWWSEVTIDPTAGTVRIVRRWGLSRSVYQCPLSSFEAVVLMFDSDNEPELYLKGAGRDLGVTWNHSRAILWGRSYNESWLIAGFLAERLQLRLDVPAGPTAA